MGNSTRVVLLAVVISSFAAPVAAQVEFIRGDVNGDGVVSLADAHAIVASQFRHGDLPTCMAAADVNVDGKYNMGDAAWLMLHLLDPDRHPISAPFPEPGACGFDSVGECQCESYGGGAPSLEDPAASLEIADVEAPGGSSRLARITIRLSNSTTLGGYIGTIIDEAGVIDEGPEGRREYGADAVLDFTGLTDIGFFRAQGARNRITFMFFTSLREVWLPPFEDMVVLEISVCLKPGTPPGIYPLSLESAEFADYDSARAIHPRLGGGTLTVTSEVADTPCIPEGSNHDVRFQLADTTGRRGSEVAVPLSVKTNRGAQGIQFSVAFDGVALEVVKVVPAWVRPDGLPYEFAVYNNQSDSLGGYFIASTPADQVFLPRDEDVRFVDLRFAVKPGAPEGKTRIQFLDGAKTWCSFPCMVCNPTHSTCFSMDSFRNFLASGAVEVTPEVADSFVLIDGFMTIVGDVSFFRSDANGDGAVDISDAVFTLGFLYQGGKRPACLEAADANGDGAVDISDPIVVLRDLFLNAGASLPHCELAGSQSALGCDGGPVCRP